MKSKLRTVFLKQECVTRSVFICLGLVALIGAIVILCDGYKGDYLGPSAIIASYSFIVDIVFACLVCKKYLDSLCNDLFWCNRNDFLYALFG